MTPAVAGALAAMPAVSPRPGPLMPSVCDGEPPVPVPPSKSLALLLFVVRDRSVPARPRGNSRGFFPEGDALFAAPPTSDLAGDRGPTECQQHT